MDATGIAARVERALRSNGGALFVKPTVVYRNTYCGRGILGDNRRVSSPAADSRGYLPVERWVMSACEAENPEPLAGEGLAEVVLDAGATCTFRQAVESCGAALLGDCPPSRWPLIKVLDIGGDPVSPDFHEGLETPPIPPHVHPGPIVGGAPAPPGKVEAYFFPQAARDPHEAGGEPVVTRLGLRPGIGPDELGAAVSRFGRSDEAYSMLEPYPVRPGEGWMIPHGVVHSPGPWITIEIQTPQDDYNLLAWQLGARLGEPELSARFQDSVLRGLPDVKALLRAIDWERSCAPDFSRRFRRTPETLSEAEWGTVERVFFEPFDGDLVTIEPGSKCAMPSEGGPRAVLVWSGSGRANGARVEAGTAARSEFFLAPGREINLECDGASPMVLFVFRPIAGE
jgi:hypothetical protein